MIAESTLVTREADVDPTLDPAVRPTQDETPEHFMQYVERVGPGDVRDTLEDQATSAVQFLRRIPDDRTLYRYAPGKWSVREVLGHINDTERIFAYRAMWIARGLEAHLPGFNQDAAMETAGSDSRSWSSHIAEFEAIRGATTALFRNLPSEAWSRKGVASERTVSVRALAYLIAGHVEHHLAILRERYSLG